MERPSWGGLSDLRLDDYAQRGGRRLGAHGGWTERAREVEEGVFVCHGDSARNGGVGSAVVLSSRARMKKRQRGS